MNDNTRFKMVVTSRQREVKEGYIRLHRYQLHSIWQARFGRLTALQVFVYCYLCLINFFFYVFKGKNQLMNQKLGYPNQKHKITPYSKKHALEKRKLVNIQDNHSKTSICIKKVQDTVLSRKPIFSRRHPFYATAWESSLSAIQAGLCYIISDFSSPVISVHPIPTLMISQKYNFWHLLCSSKSSLNFI